MPATLFCSYSHEDRELKRRLEQHLAPLILAGTISIVWSDDEITAGEEFDPAIRTELDHSDVVLLLISASYFSSRYCWEVEARRAFERHETDSAVVVPIILRDVAWGSTPINRLSVLPKNLIAVTSWPNLDEALKNVAIGIEQLIRKGVRKLAASDVGTTAAHSEEDADLSFYCQPEFQIPRGVLRGQGVAELLPDIVLRFNGDPGVRRIADVSLFANTNVTSPFLNSSNLSEAFLSVATRKIVTKLPVLGRGIHAIQNGVNSIAFLHVPLHELGALPTEDRNLRISGVRVNASLLRLVSNISAANSDLLIDLRVGDVSVRPTGTISPAEIAGDFAVAVETVDNTVDFANLSQSRSLNAHFLDDPASGPKLSFLLRFRGFLSGPEDRGQRTRILVNFAGVSPGLSLFATVEQVSADPVGMFATLTETDQNAYGWLKRPENVGYANFANHPPIGLAQIPVETSRGRAVWEIDSTSTHREQEVAVGLVVAYRGYPLRHLPSLGSTVISVNLGPISRNPVASREEAVPRFNGTGPYGINLFRIGL